MYCWNHSLSRDTCYFPYKVLKTPHPTGLFYRCYPRAIRGHQRKDLEPVVWLREISKSIWGQLYRCCISACHFRSYKGQLRYITLLVSRIHPYPRLAYSRRGGGGGGGGVVVHYIWYKESQWIKRCQWWSTHWPFPLMNTLGTHGGCGAWQWSTLTTNVLICQSGSWHGWFMYNTALNIGRTNTSFITLTHSRTCFSESNVSHTMASCGM